jgi:hypothetical protein
MANLLSWAALVFGLILGLYCAKGAKALGQQLAVTRFTSVTSVRDTISRHIAAFGTAAVAGIVFVILAAVLIIFTPDSAPSWAPLASKVVGFAANLTLGLAAGVGTHVASILAKPRLCDSIDCALEMKRRTRWHLTKFLAVVAFSLATLAGHSTVADAAPAVWVWAIDITDSVDPVQRNDAVASLIQHAPETAAQLGAGLIQVVKFDDAVMLSESTWVPVPVPPLPTDCQKAKPMMTDVDGFMGLSPGLVTNRKRQAVSACLAQERDKAGAYASEVHEFRGNLETATRVRPRADVTTLIVPLVEWLLTRPGTVAITLVTDGIDHSHIPLSALRIPSKTSVTLIITRPNQRRTRPTLTEVLNAAAAWGRVPGIEVTSAGDYLGRPTMIAEARR